MRKLNNWYKLSSSSAKPNPKPMLTGFSSVFFVPSTPGSKLLKMLKITEEQNMIGQASRIKFIETSGRRYIDHLRVKDPYQVNCLPEERCFICNNTNKPTNCKSTNIGYSIVCKTCKERKFSQTVTAQIVLRSGDMFESCLRCASHMEPAHNTHKVATGVG